MLDSKRFGEKPSYSSVYLEKKYARYAVIYTVFVLAFCNCVYSSDVLNATPGSNDQNGPSPMNTSQLVTKLHEISKGKIIKQTSVRRTANPNHLAVVELSLDLTSATGKQVFKTIVGDPVTLSYAPAALDVKPEAGSIVSLQGVFRFDPAINKWDLQIENPSLDLYRSAIEGLFLETSQPYAQLIGIYYQQYLQYQKIGRPSESTEMLNKIQAIKHPGLQYYFDPTTTGEHKQEFTFYENGLIKQLTYINNGEITAKVINELADRETFSVTESDMGGAFKPGDQLYSNLMKVLERPRRPGKKSIGIIFEKSARGLMIENVYRNSPAYKAGLKPGDSITSVQEKLVTGLVPEEAVKLFASYSTINIAVKESDGTVKNVTLEKVDDIEFMDEAGQFELAYPR